MGKNYRLETGEEMESRTNPIMRIWCQRPGPVGPDGKLITATEQHHKRECDVNEIIKKYDKQGLITHVSKFEARYGDLQGVDFKEAMDLITGAQSKFNELPAEIRKRFRNDPGELITFMEDENNREEAIQLGLIDRKWTPETDGLGEHVKLGENKEKDPEKG